MFGVKINKQRLNSILSNVKSHLNNGYHNTKSFLNHVDTGVRTAKQLYAIVEPIIEKIALAEAKRVGIPVVAIADTNCNPDEIDYPIPANDDAIRAVKLICSKIADAVILAPAMHEGLDLKDDLGRFQIICKVPYPSKGDPQVSARMELAPKYYDHRTMTKLIQSCGRIIRHENDHGKTYVLDEDFKRFMGRNSKMVPKWFAKSIVW
jgi:hypothetical protein